ncbi:MAG: acetyl-CoA carboxylase, biotin carboxyl carrier protein [Propionibacteriales bacterium]|nr:acetyl-CoA carboxylase, biotin carboxyl carrier protein [Propionibacteriales bacterium]
MELTHEEVLEILDLVDRSDVEYLELEVGRTRLVADKTGTGMSRRDCTSGRPDVQSRREDETAPAETAPAEPTSGDSDLVTVDAPVVGVFYRSPEPGAPPFVEVGMQVDEDTTVGLVEVMKMFNSVPAGVRGEVVELFAENEAFVEYGQPLMAIRPQDAG